MYPVNTTDRVQFRDPPYDEDFLGFQVLSAQSKSKLGNFTTEYPCNGPSSVLKGPEIESSFGRGLGHRERLDQISSVLLLLD